MKLVRTDSSSPDFVQLRAELDKELNKRYGKAQGSYDKHNKVESLGTVMVGYVDEEPVACGCFKVMADNTIEVKRMYVRAHHRRKGFSGRLLLHLEQWAAELGNNRAVLETGKGQPEAVALYEKCGYQKIENYGPYKELENSVCMAKTI